MELTEHDFRPDYNKSDHNIAEDFYLPAMRSSCRYDRISGYFGSTIYILAWSALQEFVDNGGKIRLICSPIISDADKEAMTEGYSAVNDEMVKEALSRELKELFAVERLSKPSRALACLVAEGIIDVKVAVPESGMEPDLERLFHDKVGVFFDRSGNAVGFRGSMNETFQGLSDGGNLESIDVFPSWADWRDSQRLESAVNYFNRLWSKTESNVLVYDFPEAVQKSLIEKSNGYDWRTLVKEISTSVSLAKKWSPNKRNSSRVPREHQLTALENWVKNGRRGILEHATGSGKTFTAICAIRDALDRGKTVLVLVPSKELLRQWKNEIEIAIKDIPIRFLMCGDGFNSWKCDNTLQLWTRPSNGENKVTIAIMDTACSNQFVQSVVSGTHLLLVADEVHRIGSPARKNTLRIDAGERLGLSATPVRYGDPVGTSAIFDYFGGVVPPVFSLEDAIKSGVLTKYYYHPLQVHLTSEEQDDWNAFTKEIRRMIAMYKKKGESISSIIASNSRLQMKLLARARIVKQAKNKISLALDVVKKYYKKNQKWIVYCDNQGQLGTVLSLLLKNGYDAYEYHSDMSGDRDETLNYFGKYGGVLVSIRCLDEGVDIPSTTHALILASSKNPREFIQRRGRILRRYPGKHFAQLYDAIVVPEQSCGTEDDTDSSIVLAELSRAIQFGEWAENPSCVSDLRIIARRYGINYQDIKDGGLEDDGETEFE
ncbi:Superfamily II DNA or RNA helicase [Anaerovibrio lipolyticus DSM 3074]|uniref:Type III restriction protein res subunit n=2 Tax=Anaerovibrio lipolyticus TaxID=82374 RepID=A0A0B2JZM0_9FIRM|nr:DEAD/DEAH box helicase family protein [Anaerovibrio lipolyticus]KHM52066.1 type III restriction protein res subunit [Anaerovibrio lipolyticus]SHI65763.1 Superfamily II DNA or RNA helicase [Anaerovibrio lipolyticus DSM 3074]